MNEGGFQCFHVVVNLIFFGFLGLALRAARVVFVNDGRLDLGSLVRGHVHLDGVCLGVSPPAMCLR